MKVEDYIIPEVRQMIKDLYIKNSPISDMIAVYIKWICLALKEDNWTYTIDMVNHILDLGNKDPDDTITFWKRINIIKQEVKDESYGKVFDKYWNQI